MAKKQRFRDTKQGNKTKITKKEKVEKPTIPFAGNAIKAKAFLTDTFMLFIPIVYIVIYLVMGGLQNAGEEKLLTWAYTLIPFLTILTIFMIKDEGRTPGARSQQLKVIDFHTLAKPSLFLIIFRNLSFLLTLTIPFSWFIPFFRKDKRGLHDFLSGTCLIIDPTPPKNLVYKPKS
jgi:uncharacterized RDD family membrane protein YckC